MNIFITVTLLKFVIHYCLKMWIVVHERSCWMKKYMLVFASDICFLIYLLLLFNSILSERLSSSLWWSDVLLFSEVINIVSILLYFFIKFIILLYSFSIIYLRDAKNLLFATFSNLSDALPTLTSAKAIGYLWSICLRVKILIPSTFLSII